jgi:hypothetical protein
MALNLPILSNISSLSGGSNDHNYVEGHTMLIETSPIDSSLINTTPVLLL